MSRTTKQRMRERKPKPLAKDDKENLSGSLILYWNRVTNTLKVTFPEYLKLLEGLFESSGFNREAWVCRMFREKQFHQLFSEADLPLDTEGGRRQCLEYGELLERILLASCALRKFSKNLRNEIAPQQRERVSTAEVSFAQKRFKQLTEDEKKPRSANLAYRDIARDLRRLRRSKKSKKLEVSKSTVRRMCDERFARQSGCIYRAQEEKPEPVDLDFDPATLWAEKEEIEEPPAYKRALALLSTKRTASDLTARAASSVVAARRTRANEALLRITLEPES
jgi:hypothetical protein